MIRKTPLDRRTLLRLAALAAADHLSAQPPKQDPGAAGRKAVLVTLGGIRRQETFSLEGVVNIPRLANDLAPHGLFFPNVMNDGVTAHVNTISSIVTGAWQQLDDWGRHAPRHPTLFTYLQKQRHLGAADTWVVTSNKAVTRNIGVGANVILSKQLMVEAVERIILGQSPRRILVRDAVRDEMKAIMLAEYERIGWTMPSASRNVTDALVGGLTDFFDGPEGLTGGDEFTFVMAREVLRRLKPALMVINFSGVEVAHSGTYSLHLAGIRSVDMLCYRLWQFLDSEPSFKGRTTMVVMPEFGRDPDGSTTNGFFNHRTDTKICRLTWMLALGDAVREPRVEERTISHIDVAPTIGGLFGVDCKQADGKRIDGFAI
ncbi:MAG: hypothetical protein KIT09_07810 [Bryobacteraceae bacterium]|nr:hypothetical protein [Bryobacteraceae bacterium]